MKAFLKNYRQSPRKVRLVASLLRGKDVPTARVILGGTIKKSSAPIKKLLDSAVANAKQFGESDESLLSIKEIRVDEGITMSRSMPRARGASSPIRKRTSRILIVLGKRQVTPAKKKSKV
ncbi:MAG TPA: 50S ribosomal protein L22 [Candidatus Paceibacterota bacterium]